MSNKRFPEESKIEAVKQITENWYPVIEVANRLWVYPSTEVAPLV